MARLTPVLSRNASECQALKRACCSAAQLSSLVGWTLQAHSANALPGSLDFVSSALQGGLPLLWDNASRKPRRPSAGARAVDTSALVAVRLPLVGTRSGIIGFSEQCEQAPYCREVASAFITTQWKVLIEPLAGELT